ncbi:hypothetical protein GGI23_003454, partial [Coemansia sp. RSA 2559]
ACQVVQEGSVGMDNAKTANSPDTGQNTPSVTPPPPAAPTIKPEPETDLSAVDPTATANGNDVHQQQQQQQQQPAEADNSGNGAAPIDASSVCVWDIIQRMVSGQEVMDDSSAALRTTPGFIGLNHIDRSSRHRGLHQERAIKILN